MEDDEYLSDMSAASTTNVGVFTVRLSLLLTSSQGTANVFPALRLPRPNHPLQLLSSPQPLPPA